VIAQYDINVYTVVFKDWDDTVLATQNVEHGTSVTAPANPTREGFVFEGWSVDFSSITGDLSVIAQYDINVYTVIFKDWNETVLSTQNIEHGASASAPVNPTRVGHAFKGWNANFSNITGDLTVTAQYGINIYTVEFKDWDGTVLSTQKIEHGTSASAPETPTRESYTFKGWDTNFSIITDNLTVTAQYDTNVYMVIFVDWDGTELDMLIVEHGESATAPKNPTREGHTFRSWDTDYSRITGDLTVTAQYDINVYMVVFVDWDGTELDMLIVEYGRTAAAPINPTREGYTFVGWDTDFSNITGDLTVTAQYEPN
jgi:uncharacterized repeat protein (TIGR02543 family)